MATPGWRFLHFLGHGPATRRGPERVIHSARHALGIHEVYGCPNPGDIFRRTLPCRKVTAGGFISQDRMSKNRAANSRGALTRSFGKIVKAAGTPICPIGFDPLSA